MVHMTMFDVTAPKHVDSEEGREFVGVQGTIRFPSEYVLYVRVLSGYHTGTVGFRVQYMITLQVGQGWRLLTKSILLYFPSPDSCWAHR